MTAAHLDRYDHDDGLPPTPWQNAMEWGGHDIGDPLPSRRPLANCDWTPAYMELLGVIGDLLADKYPDGFAIAEQRLLAFSRGEHRAWETHVENGMVRLKIVNGS